jgi:alpha/beta superfamily hydrolase
MVLAGQFLERATLISRPLADGSSLALEGLYHRGAVAPAVVICAPHPRMGGSMDSPVVSELAWALSQRGHATLRFNYQGVGASPGEIQATDLESEIADGAAAVTHLRETVEHHRIAVAGYSFGAAIALALARRHTTLTQLVLVSPPTSLLDFSALQDVLQPALIVTGENDSWVNRPQLAEIVAHRSAATLEVISDADHVYARGLTELGRTVAGWLGKAR